MTDSTVLGELDELGLNWHRERFRRMAVAEVFWKPIKRAFCDRVDEEVFLEARMIYPSGVLMDRPPRIEGHRCSKGMECNLFDKAACCWAGTQPNYDPFK